MLFEDNTVECPAEPYNRKEIYGIIAFRIVGEDTTRSSIDALHQTIFLQAEFDYCNKQNVLKWNNYISWGSDFDKYDIFYKNNIGVFINIGATTYNDTVFYHENVDYNTDYEYYIKASRTDGTESLSNIRELHTQTINFPEYLNIDSLLVKDKVNLVYSIDNNSDTERYILYKASSKTGLYDSISGIVNTDKSTLNFTDDYNQSKNYYYVSAIDYCGSEIFKSIIASNILLSVNKLSDSEKVNELDWEHDSGENFKIIRCNNENNNCSEIDETYELDYSDNIQAVFEDQFNNQITNGIFCYWVQYKNDNFLNISNTECVSYEETIFIANAFNPNSNIEENRTFKPKIAFISDYELIVYGNFGNIIFQTNNPNFGWNGKLPDGKLAARASYLYFISFTNSFGKKIKQKGIVSLVY